MIPNVSAIPDLLSGLVSLPDTGSVGQGQEEEQATVSLQQVGTNCPICGRRVVRLIISTRAGVRQLQELLISDKVQLVCNRCVRNRILPRHNGRT